MQEVQQLRQGITDIANNTEFNTIKLLNIGAVTPPPTTTLDIAISANERKTVGYIEVKPGGTSPLEIFCDFSAMGNADYPDLNIVGPNGEIYGYLGSYLKSSSAQTINNLPSASSGTYSGYKSKIESLSSERSKFGAYMNVLEHVQNNTGAYKESLTAAESRVRDTDIAKMSITLTRNQLILQAAQSVTSQANQMSQGILELLK